MFIRPMTLRYDRFEDLKYLSEKELKSAKLPPNLPQSKPMVMK